MAKIERLVPIILKWEGGWSKHPADRGGATMAGITHATYKRYRKDKGKPEPTEEDLRHISAEEWTDILRTYYWNPCKADSIVNQSIANLIVNSVWGSGTGYIKVIQRDVLKVKADGIVGVQTLSAINSASQRDLFNRLWQRRKAYFEGIVEKNPSQRIFLRGWLNRLNDFTFSPT